MTQFPFLAQDFINRQNTIGNTMRGNDISVIQNDVLLLTNNVSYQGNTFSDLTTNFNYFHPFVGTTSNSFQKNLFGNFGDIVWTGNPTASDGIITLNGASQSGVISIDISRMPQGTDAITIGCFFKLTTNIKCSLMGIGNNSTGGSRFGLAYDGVNFLAAECLNVSKRFIWSYDSNWHFLCATIKANGDGGLDPILYFDGTTPFAGALSSAVMNVAAGEYKIGGVPSYQGGEYFVGSIKNPFLAKRQLSATEVNQIWLTLKNQVGL